MKNYALIPKSTLEWISKIEHSKNQYRILCYLMSQLNYTDWTPISATQIAGALGMNSNTVTIVLHELLESGLIDSGRKISGVMTYKLIDMELPRKHENS